MKRKTKWWAPVVHFIVHAMVGAVIFIVIGAIAVGLGFLVNLLEAWGVSEFTISVLTVLEKIILVVDGVCFMVYLVKTAYQAIKEF